MTLTTLAILGFVLIQLGIGYWASRRIAHEDDYLVAGRRLKPWVAGFSLFVTWFGAESILGSSAAIHEDESGPHAPHDHPVAEGVLAEPHVAVPDEDKDRAVPERYGAARASRKPHSMLAFLTKPEGPQSRRRS